MQELTERVCESRGIEKDDLEMVKIGADSGQGSFKACMSLLTEGDVLPGMQNVCTYLGGAPTTHSTCKKTYNRGKNPSFNFSTRHKLIFLANFM